MLGKSVAIHQAGGGGLPMPKDMGQVVDFAQLMCKSGPMIPFAFQGKPGVCMGVTMQALRWEMDPFAVCQKAYVTKDKSGNERIAYEAQLISAVINTRAPLKGRLKITYDGEGEARRCKVSGLFRGETEPHELVTPRISQIGVKNSPLWKSDPDQQLAYYGQRAWGRRYCPEVIMGVYSPEEISTIVLGPSEFSENNPAPRVSLAATMQDDYQPTNEPHDPETGEIEETQVSEQGEETPDADGPADNLEVAVEAETAPADDDDTFPGDRPWPSKQEVAR